LVDAELGIAENLLKESGPEGVAGVDGNNGSPTVVMSRKSEAAADSYDPETGVA